MTGPVVLITGCSQGGIGDALCQQFALAGCHVYASARRLESMSSLDGCDMLTMDVTDQSSIKKSIETVIEKSGHIDILVNNAGCSGVGALVDFDMDQARRCIDTNVFGTLSVCKEVGKHMIKRGSGKIVNIGSVVGYASTPWTGIYAMSKAAVHSMTSTLCTELAPFGIHVTLVAPGAIRSNFGNNAMSVLSIPQDSFYASVAEYIYKRATMSQGPRSVPADVFAAKLVEVVMRNRPPRYFTYGTHSTMFYLFYYLPDFVKDFVFSRMMGVNKVKKPVTQQ